MSKEIILRTNDGTMRNGQLDETPLTLDRLEQEIVALTACLRDFQATGTGSSEAS